jgi:hypothetical protein
MKVVMRVKLSAFFDTMALMIVLWLCSLPLIALVILPLFGQCRRVYLSLNRVCS